MFARYVKVSDQFLIVIFLCLFLSMTIFSLSMKFILNYFQATSHCMESEKHLLSPGNVFAYNLCALATVKSLLSSIPG